MNMLKRMYECLAVLKQKLPFVSKECLVCNAEAIALRDFEESGDKDRIALMLMSESSLAKDWDTPEEDEAWKDL